MHKTQPSNPTFRDADRLEGFREQNLHLIYWYFSLFTSSKKPRYVGRSCVTFAQKRSREITLWTNLFFSPSSPHKHVSATITRNTQLCCHLYTSQRLRDLVMRARVGDGAGGNAGKENWGKENLDNQNIHFTSWSKHFNKTWTMNTLLSSVL